MAKTIMISNDVYERLKSKKGEKSFSEVINELLSPSKKAATFKELIERCSGTLPANDAEYDEVLAESRKKWDEWKEQLEKQIRQEESS